ncbi:ArsR/SmtB family transcription factor [Nocardiopsis ganjiahuensis]|uniref:ArsR/SmtB family transcription factor n=1 Tax=Nocardiopsis ganjiahuensis TaxID=239984 RepID=UPI00034BB091|nr:metalloregulator ArsR/SmtB family transcription factor [Nocardiopsis ganjiahuensis]
MTDDQISTPEEFKALAHPLRQRMLFLLGDRPATVSQLAVTLDTRKGNVSHHLKALRSAGLVEPAESRQVRGGTEQYYRRTARRIEIADARPGPAAAVLRAVSEEFSEAPGDPLLALRHLRLTEEQAERLHETLLALVSETPEAEEGRPRYGLLVSFYQQPAAPTPG